MPHRTLIVGPDLSVAEVDAISSGLVTIDEVHNQIHDGHHYYLVNYVELNNNGTLDLVLETDDSCYIHEVMSFQSTGSTTIQCYRDCVAAENGTLVELNNSNANSSNTSCLVLRSNPTVSDVGDLKQAFSIGAGSNPGNSRSGSGARENETVLKLSTKYLCRITSGANSNKISYQMYWYESQIP